MVAGSNPHHRWPGVRPGNIPNLFTDLGRIEDWVGLAARGSREICWNDLRGESNPGRLHGSTMVYPLCYSCCNIVGNFTLKNPDFFNINIRNKWKCLLLFHDWFPVKFEFIHIQYFFGMVRNKSSHRRGSVGKGILRNLPKFLGKHLRQSLFINKVAGLRKKDTLTRVFSCEFYEIFKNTFFTEHLWFTASWEIKPNY